MTKPGHVQRPTSRDVARLAGVSQTTVSFVINQVEAPGISEETRARVHQAIAALDYHPHEGARSLSRRATRGLGVAIPDAHNPHYLEIAEGIEAYAESQGYSVFLAITNFEVSRERRCLQWLKQQRVDALILSSSTGGALAGEVEALRDQGHEIVALGWHLPDPNTPGLAITVGRGEQLIVEHLATLGHRHIGYIYGVADQAIFGLRLQACLAAQRGLGLPVVDAWVRRCGPTAAEGYQATRDLLAACAGGERPTALIAVNDLLAAAVLAALHTEQIAVPTAMSVASFDNTQLAAYTVPPLTTIDADARALGAHVARVAIDRLAGRGHIPAQAEGPARLVVRGSTGPPPAHHGRQPTGKEVSVQQSTAAF
jgi:LacI family transcriptional regulator